MSISSINYSSSLLGQSVQNINNQLSNLSTQLSSGVKSPDYAGMGVNEGFAIAARSQLANIAAFGDAMTGVNTIIDAANTALQSLSTTVGEAQSEAAATPQNLTSSGQTIGQENALAQLSAIVGVMNTQVGNRYIFSGTAINTPAMASADDILDGNGTQAGLKQVIAERQQADLGATGLGRLVITQPTAASVKVAEDVAGSPFGLKLNAVSSSLTNATVSGPSGSPPSVSVDMTAGNPNPGDQISWTFNLPDGTTQTVQLTASNTTPPAAYSFAIGTTPAATAANLNAALNNAIGTVANTSLAAASAVAAGDNFFNTDSIAIGAVKNNQASPPAPITGATALSGTAPSDSLSSSFAAGDTITVNGQAITFVSGTASGNNQISTSDNIKTLLSKIDAITGTSTPSTISGGVITLHTDNASTLSVSSSNTAAFAALGFSGTVTAVKPPLRVSGSPLSSATTFASGSANTVAWYTGNSGPGSPRSSATVRVDDSQTVQFGAQASEQAIRQAIQNIAVYAAFKTTLASANNGTTVNNQATPPAPITGATALSGTSGTDSLSTGFAVGDTITVNGQTITFKASGATGNNQINVTDTVQTLLQKIDAITGTSTPSTVSGGVITLHTDNVPLTMTSSAAGAFAALGFSGTVTANNSGPVVAALSQRIGANLTPQTGQQTISDIQTDFATAQTTMKDAQARQTQTKTALQNLISDSEGIDQNQVASQMLALQTSLQASYQTTAMLSQLSLVKFLPVA
jgi:flagellar hook-associated protein 3 FlgL